MSLKLPSKRAFAIVLLAAAGMGGPTRASADVYIKREVVADAWAEILKQTSHNSSTRLMTINGHRHRVTSASHEAPIERVLQQLMTGRAMFNATSVQAVTTGSPAHERLQTPEIIQGPGWSAIIQLPDILLIRRPDEPAPTNEGRITLVFAEGPKRSSSVTVEGLTPASVIDSVRQRRMDTDVHGDDAESVVRYPGSRRALSLLEELADATTRTVAYVGPGQAAEHGAHYLRRLRAAGFETIAVREQSVERFFAQLRKDSMLVSIYCVVKQGRVVGLIQEMRTR